MARLHLATLVEDFRRHGAQPAVVVHSGIRSRVYSYGELAELSRRFAAELIRREIAAGERVVLWGLNSAEWIAAFFGCVLRGVLVVPLDAACDPAFALRVIDDTRPRLLAADRALLPRLAAARAAGFPFLVLEDLAASLPQPPRGAALEEPTLGPETPLQILFTSGTTSEPKGVVHTHRNILASLEPIEREMQKYLRYERIVHPLRFLHTLPLSHVFGQMIGLWIPPLMAAEVHFENRQQAPRLLELIRRHRISVLAAVPRLLDLLRAELIARTPHLPERLEAARGQSLWRRWWSFRDVHRALGLKFWALVSGGASLPPALESFWRDLGLAVIQGYGMTETAALITLNHPFHLAQGSVGKPLPGREVRIGGDGEVLVRGEMVSGARWQNGRMTAVADSWLATGDLAEQGSEGELHFRGRKSETIVTASGLNVHPEDVEAALEGHPGVEAAAVVPLHTPSGTEPVAVLIFRGGAGQLPSVIDAANASLAEYQRVRRWWLWPQLDFPRTTMGKMQRHKIAEWVATQAMSSGAGAAHPPSVGECGISEIAEDPLAALVASITRVQPARIAEDARLDRDFHLDSLARVQLQAELEQCLGVSLGEEEFELIATLGELRAALGEAGLHDGLGERSRGELAPSQISGEHAAASSTEPGDTAQTAAAKDLSASAASPAAALGFRRGRVPYRYPEWPWWPPVQAVRVLFQELVMRPLVWLLAAPAVRRSKKFAAPDQPLLLIANHVTAYDPPLILYALPAPMRRRVAIAMAAETLEDLRYGRNWGHWFLNLAAPLGYWAITVLFNVFPLPRAAGLRQSFAHAGRAMDRGYHVLIFPEGVRSADGTLQPFRPGVGVLARESAADVLPVAMAGLGELKQRKHGWLHWSWFRSGTLEVRVGERLKSSPEAVPESLRRALASLLEGKE